MIQKNILMLVISCLLFNYSTQAQKNNPAFIVEFDSIFYQYKKTGEYNKLLPYAQAVVAKSAQELGEQDTIHARMLFLLGLVYYRLENYDKGVEYYKKAMTIQKQIAPESLEYANAMVSLAGIYQYNFSQYSDAEELYLKAQRIYKKNKYETSMGYATILDDISNLHVSLGNYEKAESFSLESMKLHKKITGGTDPLFLHAINNLANIYHNLGAYEDAEPLYLEALKIIKKTRSTTDETYAIILNNLADMYSVMSKYEESESMFLEAQEVFKNIFGEQHPNYAVLLNNLAFLYKNMKKYKEAEVMFLQALNVNKIVDGDKHPNYAKMLNNLALLYNETAQYEKAEPLFLQSAQIFKQVFGNQHPLYAQAINNLALLYSTIKKYDSAESLLFQAKEIRKQALGLEHPLYANSLNNLAFLYISTNRLDSAIAFTWSAIAVNSENFDAIFPDMFSKKVFDSLEKYQPNFCCKKLEKSDFLKLPKLKYRDFTSINSSLESLLKVYDLIYKKAKAEDKTAALEMYYSINKAAMQINELIRNDFSDRSSKMRALKQGNRFIKNGIETALKFKETTYLEEAFMFAEQNKSVLLIDAIKGDKAKVLGYLPDSLAEKELALQKSKDQIHKQKYEAKTAEQKSAVLAKENLLNSEINTFLKFLKTNFPQYHALKYENITATAKDVQKLLDDKTMMIEYFVTDSIVYLFALTQSKIELLPLAIAPKILKERIEKLREALSNYALIVKKEKEAYSLYTETAHWFYKELLERVLKGNASALQQAQSSTNSGQENIENLILITDGELGHLPFEAFLTEQAPQSQTAYKNLHYLVKDYNISYDYSATLWKENKNTKRHDNNGQILACAATYPSINYWNESAITALSDLRLPHLVELRKHLQPLPEVQHEVAELSKNFQGLFLQKDSTNERFFKAHAAEYGIIHLAMHGLLHPRLPMLSSLAFTENKDSIEDNFLEAYEISHLNLNADLVVLSACETGYGQFEQGEGVVSLARSFMYAGVPSLIVSLWQVNDASTAIIMKSFYQYLADGMPKDAALRQAKLDYLQSTNGIVAHPAFWSAFIQLGDSRPIKIAGKTNWLWWALGGVTLLLAGGIFFKKRTTKK